MSEKLWYKVARTFIKAGKLPIPVNDTGIEILKIILNEEQAKFVLLFKNPSYSLEELKKVTDLDDKALDKMLKDLMSLGVISGIPSRSTGIMVYRLLPLLPGLLETTFMKGKKTEKEIKLAKLFDAYIDELAQGTQKNYDNLISEFKKGPAITRIIPVEQELEVKKEVSLPFERVSKIIESSDLIGVATCYCRHEKDLLGRSCKVTNERKNCVFFNKTAEFFISQGFAQSISKSEATKILKKAEDDGLVHKAFHTKLDLNKEIDAICNCCKCCCGTFQAHYKGAWPIMEYASYLPQINEDACVSCETCVNSCSTEAMELIDTIATVNENRCIGCGVCAHLCPEKAIKMIKTEPRKVFVPPPRLATL